MNKVFGKNHSWNCIITYMLLFSHSVTSNSLQPHGLQHTRLPSPSSSLRACSNSCAWIGDAIQLSHRLLSPSPPAFNLSQHQGLFQWVGSAHQVAKVLELQLWHQSFHWLDLLAAQGALESSPAPQLVSVSLQSVPAPVLETEDTPQAPAGGGRPECQLHPRSTSALLSTPQPLAAGSVVPLLCFHNKLWKILRDGNTRPPDLPPEKSVCRLGRNS